MGGEGPGMTLRFLTWGVWPRGLYPGRDLGVRHKAREENVMFESRWSYLAHRVHVEAEGKNKDESKPDCILSRNMGLCKKKAHVVRPAKGRTGFYLFCS